MKPVMYWIDLIINTFCAETDSDIEGGYEPSYAAAKIRESIQLQENEIIIAPLQHSILQYVKILCPPLYFKILEGLAKNGGYVTHKIA